MIGAPAFFLLKRIELMNWWFVISIGALVGLVVGYSSLGGYLPLAACVGQGLGVSIIAWLLVSRYAL
jgi:hypothetical protein